MQGEFWENFSWKKCVSWGRKQANYNSIISTSLGMFSKWITDRYKGYLKSIHPQVSIHLFFLWLQFYDFSVSSLLLKTFIILLQCPLFRLRSCRWELWLLTVTVCHQWMWVDGHFECSGLVTLINHLGHFNPFTHSIENTLYPHWAGKCKFWPLSITPPTTNISQSSVLPRCKRTALQSFS